MCITIQEGRTALALASWKGHKQTVDVLLKAGAKPDIQDQVRGCTCVYDDQWDENHQEASLCFSFLQGKGWTALFFATAEGHVDIVKMLLEYGTEVNIKDRVRVCVVHQYLLQLMCFMCRLD